MSLLYELYLSLRCILIEHKWVKEIDLVQSDYIINLQEFEILNCSRCRHDKTMTYGSNT